eukprot:gene6627-8199_t
MKWINKKSFGKYYVESLEENEDIVLLTMNDNENRFNSTNVSSLNSCLDYIESLENVSCLITTSTSPKFYSTGLDLDWALPLGKDNFIKFIDTFHHLLKRILVLPFVTISCINGHAFAGGAMFAIAHDFRVMRDDRGFFCLPEVDINIPLTPGMNALLQTKISNSVTYRDVVLLGKRYGGVEAKKLEIIDIATKNVLEESVHLAEKVFSKGKNRMTFGGLKRELYKHADQLLTKSELGESGKLSIFDQKSKL